MMILALFAIGLFIYYLSGGKDSSCFTRINNKGPESILKERFVNGEIDEKTYLQMKEAIK